MENRELAKIFYTISDFLGMEKDSFRSRAYRVAAQSLENLEISVKEIYNQQGKESLERIPGVGEGIAQKIEEYLKTGKIKYYERLKNKTPLNIRELIQIEGMGPKRAHILYEQLGISNLKELERAAKQNKIAPLPGFGEKTQKNILEGIEFLKASRGRFLLGEVLPEVERIKNELGLLKEIRKIVTVGSVRRRKETIGDIDILIAVKDSGNLRTVGKVMDFFVNMPNVVKVWGKGLTKASIRLAQGFDVDLRVVSMESFGAALQYFTGSKNHNIVIRKIAKDKGFKLNEYGLFIGRKKIAGRTEKEIYKRLGMDLMPPEIRENEGEIKAALENRLPKLIDYSDIKGDLHCHSSWDGGVNSILEMAEAAMGLGYKYIGVSDHTKFLRIENGLDEKQLVEQRKEIDVLNAGFEIKNKKFRILQSAETNILKDGSVDIKDDALKKLDYVIAGIHSNFKMEKEDMTERIIKAMKNPYISIISHPTGRILKKRDEYQIDFERILRAAKEFDVILEINSFPSRLDLSDKKIRMAKEAGVKMVINTDSHHKAHLQFIELGIAQARRGWAEKEDIINTQPLKRLLKSFGKQDKLYAYRNRATA